MLAPVLLLLAPGFVCAQTLEEVVAGLEGAYAKIYIDGNFRREAISHSEDVKPGTHVVMLEREGYLTVDKAVVVGAGDTVVVRLPMRRGAS